MTDEADYLIAGAGSAGAVLAARLSEDPNCRVVLLEAGGKGDSFLVKMPAGSFALMGHKTMDWNYPVEPDPSINGRTFTWSGGKMLGGSSAINGMVYVRGQRGDYARWEAVGATGWGWDAMRPYYCKAENYTGPPSHDHGSTGPLNVAPANARHPMADIVKNAFITRGIAELAESCAGDQHGVYDILTTAAGGIRRSTASTYLQEARGRPNLRIITDAHVDRVLIEDGRAVGLAFIVNSEAHELRARQVIVSAGTIGSPAILMRSGIGPAAHLQDHGIAVRADLPVGQNLQEHVGINISKLVDMPTYNSPFGPFTIARDLLKWVFTKSGPMASAAVQVMAGIKSDPALSEPDLSISFLPLAIDLASGRPKMHKQPGITLGGNCMRPDSRGEIRLRSTNAMDKPMIDHRLLGDDRDLERLVVLGRFLESIYAAPPLAQHVVANNAPETRPESDEDWRDYIRATAGIGYHPVGTCAMGDKGVVDANLRVKEISGLRVVDASVMPIILSANTNAAVIAIAERAADLIKAEVR